MVGSLPLFTEVQDLTLVRVEGISHLSSQSASLSMSFCSSCWSVTVDDLAACRIIIKEPCGGSQALWEVVDIQQERAEAKDRSLGDS